MPTAEVPQWRSERDWGNSPVDNHEPRSTRAGFRILRRQMNELNIRNATLEPTTFNADNRTVSVVFASNAPVRRLDLDGAYRGTARHEPGRRRPHGVDRRPGPQFP